MRRIGMVVCLLGGLCAAERSIQVEVWSEESFEEFADGKLDSSGQNLYVARDGTVRTIHRFDLNEDGYLDLIFNSTHDTRTFVPATVATVSTARRFLAEPLPVEGGLRARLADLDQDGHLDAVFCPNDSGLQHPRRFVTLLWGSEDGWSPERAGGILPVYAATEIAVGDFNGDAWPDVGVLCGEAWTPGQPEGRVLRIYWGSDHGYLLTRYLDLGVPGGLDLETADLDDDGADDLAVLTAGASVRLFWGSRRGAGSLPYNDVSLPDSSGRCLAVAKVDEAKRTGLLVGTSAGVIRVIAGTNLPRQFETTTFAAFPATHIAAGDLDGDGNADLVLTNFSQARAAGGEAAGAVKDAAGGLRILWGTKNGFSTEGVSALEAAYATATAIGDLDGDGYTDVAVAIHQDNETFAAQSVVFFGVGGRRFVQGRDGIPTEGATDVAIAPGADGRPARIVFANSLGGTVAEAVPLHLYWGGAGGFNPERRTEIPFRSGYEATSADLNNDGFVDLVAINSQHAGPSAKDDPNGGANIFWGNAEGFDFVGRRTVLREHFLGTSNTADLNRDGYLDLVLGVFDQATPEAPTPLLIYYGSPEGFNRRGRVALPCEGRSIGSCIADFNHDGWLDLAVSSTYQNRVRIFWGAAEGFDAERQQYVEVPYPIGLETADLNADGHLDLVVGSYFDPVTEVHDTGTVIFWGSDEGFQHASAQRLPGWAPVGLTVADFDADGYLDLFTPHYLGELMRESVPCYLYWGGPDGFSARRRSTLTCDSAHDALAGDFDGDGRLDLAVSCHSKDGDHRTFSRVFYNDGERFANPRIQYLPTHGTHWMWGQDMGHIYDRSWRQTYESSVHRLANSASGAQLEYKADVPKGTRLAFAVRSATDKAGLPSATWREVSAGTFAISPNDRVLQYRAVFHSDNGDRFPVLDRVQIEIEAHR